ncbi:Vacuolar protein sorting-associated protein 41 homolog [Apodemus speciosus]|uniref:Vacuolar protein sorting-associated protein 41 homolog n=1 Tax=Apodemus speciosus TaxID=105296 RepID=A0ABQ0FFY0_APOSI
METESLEESTDESEEESEEEPKLKYERLSNGVTEILQKDAASCMTVHDKFLALGTHYGKVYLLDVQGNITQKFDVKPRYIWEEGVSIEESNRLACRQDFGGFFLINDNVGGPPSLWMVLSPSPVKINQISLDESGEHMGVCSEDGKLQVFGLYSGEEFHETFDCPIKIIAVHPQFVRSSCKQFVTGGKKLLLFERTWMNRWKSCVLHEGEGNIRSVQWRGHLIAWANNMGVKIFDITSKQRITNVPRDDISLRPDMYPCSLCWKDNLTLIIGWGTSIKICSVKERHASEMRDLPSRYVEIVSQFETEFYISGLAPLCDQLVVLSYVKEVSEKTEREYCARPRLDIIQPLPETCEEISSDALTVRGFQENECRDYHLEYSEGESLFYVVSPRDVVVAKERDQDDHIDWLLEKKKYEEALMAAEISQRNIKRHKILDIGLAYVNHLVERGEYDMAARKCQKILGKNASLWEYEVYKFKEIGQLKALEICQQRNFVEETVYLLSRMGNSRSALKMIMEELHDVDKAIEFAKEQDDGELWEDLILYSIDKPPFITGLLNNIGTHVDPILLIHRIKEGMEIPNLRDSLVKILQDYNLQILLREGCKKILVADSLSLLKKMHRTQMKGVLVDEENICESCLSPILPTDAAKPFSVVVFHCRHMFHKECLPVPSMNAPAQYCNICSAKNRGPGSAILEMKK